AVTAVPRSPQVRVEHVVRPRGHDLAGGVPDAHGRLDHLGRAETQGRRVVQGRGTRVDRRVRAGDRARVIATVDEGPGPFLGGEAGLLEGGVHGDRVVAIRRRRAAVLVPR